MSVKNKGFGGSDFESGSALASTDLNDTFNSTYRLVGEDQTEENISNSTVEEEIAEVVLQPNSIGSAIFVTATGWYGVNTGDQKNIRIYFGPSTSGTANTLLKLITRNPALGVSGGWAMIARGTAGTTSVINYVNVTGKNGEVHANADIACESLMVFAI